MSRQTDKQETLPSLVEHYRPVQLKAVLAARAIKHREPPPPPEERQYGSQLPEGFHLPQSVYDD
ncbi:hypothetical protein ASD01_07045 [Ensifer sp. Root423]|uniref:hypothetical protein n=1 Tax=unclassified Ensifer TaxID=2633371 RepID=UPI000712A94D|nr:MULTISPECIES: hypothetical protein [unclassified Ensifer]KQX16304.1 hypothetical protein ASD01_07045 [Ensifer sp. Root423]MBD9522776.1 hypothetical protein [Ensifer sp. ENS02]